MSEVIARAADFHRGLLFWINGWRYILNHRRLLTLATLPILIALGTAAFLLIFSARVVPWLVWGEVQQTFVRRYPDLAPYFYYPVLILSGVALIVITLYLAYVVHSVVAMPFYGWLAEATLKHSGKRPKGSWRKALRNIFTGVIKVLILLALGFVLLLLSLSVVFYPVAIAGAMLILAFDCMDYSFDVLQWRQRDRWQYLRREWAQWLGMAAGLALTLLIPGLTLLVIPGAVVGAAQIVKTP